MTREEASDILDDYDVNFDGHTAEEIAEAFDMAFKALEQKPCTDAISRQAVFEQIHCWIGSGEYRYTNATHYLTERVKHIPPVNPQEPKTGHREYNDIYDHYLCGNCKTVVMDYDNYCPNCGARMESEE